MIGRARTGSPLVHGAARVACACAALARGPRSGARDRPAHRGRHPLASTTEAAGARRAPTAPQRLAWEVRQRTSVETRLEPTRVRLDDPRVFDTPLLYWSGDHAFAAAVRGRGHRPQALRRVRRLRADRRRRARPERLRQLGAPRARARVRRRRARPAAAAATRCTARSTCSSGRSGRVARPRPPRGGDARGPRRGDLLAPRPRRRARPRQPRQLPAPGRAGRRTAARERRSASA